MGKASGGPTWKPRPGPYRAASPEARMSNGMFLLILIVFGFVILAYFNRRARNYKERHPGKDNPIDKWMTGKDDRDDEL